MSSEQRSIPAPQADPDTAEFWEAARAGTLMIGRCQDCGEAHYYPRHICPHCGSGKVTFEAASGDGVIYSYSVMRRAPIPYAIAYVTLAEGPVMMTNIVDCDLDNLAVGRSVRLVHKDTEDDGPPVAMFTPA